MKIIVMTCDKNCWVLPIFFHFFKKYWPDCPWPVTVVGGQKTPELIISDTRFSVFRGDDANFTDLLLSYLDGLNRDDLVLILLEDYIFMGPVDTKQVRKCRNIIRADPDVQLVRVTATPGPTLPWSAFLGLGEFDKQTPEKLSYLSSLMPTIWRVAHLRRMLRPGETAWDIEIAGSERARGLPGIYLGSMETLIGVHNYLVRGRVNPEAVREVQKKW